MSNSDNDRTQYDWLSPGELVADAARNRIAAIDPPPVPPECLERLARPATLQRRGFRVNGRDVSVTYAEYGPAPARATIVWGHGGRTLGEIAAVAESGAQTNAVYRAAGAPLHGSACVYLDIGEDVGAPVYAHRMRALGEVARVLPRTLDLITMPDDAGAAGTGAAVAAAEALRPRGGTTPTFAISGYGSHATRAMADRLCKAGAKPVAVSDGDSGTWNPAGLSLDGLNRHIDDRTAGGAALSAFPGGEPASPREVLACPADILAVCRRGGRLAAEGELVAIRSMRGMPEPVAAQHATGVLPAHDVSARLVVAIDDCVYPGALRLWEARGIRVIGSLLGAGLGAYATECRLSGARTDPQSLIDRQKTLHAQVLGHAQTWNVPEWVAAWAIAYRIRDAVGSLSAPAPLHFEAQR